MARNNERDIALIAKELGLEEDLIKPTGEGLRSEIQEIKQDLNGIGKKVNGIEERVKKLENSSNFSLPPPFHFQKEKEEKEENPNEHTYKALLGYGRKAWRVFRPLLYALGLMMLYFVGKALGVDIPLIP